MFLKRKNKNSSAHKIGQTRKEISSKLQPGQPKELNCLVPIKIVQGQLNNTRQDIIIVLILFTSIELFTHTRTTLYSSEHA